MIHIITDPRFLGYFGGALLVLSMLVVVIALFFPLIRDFIEEGKQRVERYEAREMRRRMSQSTRKP